jgi:hypothetical protein
MNEKAFLDDLNKTIYFLIKQRLESKGLPKNSKAVGSIVVDASLYDLSIQYPEYLGYWDSGRKSGGKKVPIMALVEWIKGKNLNKGKKTDTQLAFAIQTAIWKRGLKPKNILPSLMNEIIDLYLENIVEYKSEEVQKTIKEIKI